jgi:multicomponent Na+:H+ antiporter subunit G
MAVVLDTLTVVFLAVGSFFALTGAVGILRLPDFYSRIHPAGKSDTLAQLMILVGLVFQVFRSDSYDTFVGVKLILIVLLLFITSPTAVHAIARAAYLEERNPGKDEQGHD